MEREPSHLNKYALDAECTRKELEIGFATHLIQRLGYTWEDLKDKTVLDLGAGSANFAAEAEQHGIKVFSVDENPSLMSRTQRKWTGWRWVDYPQPEEKTRYVKARGQKFPFRDNIFDLIFSHQGPFMGISFIDENHPHFRGDKFFVDLLNDNARVLKPRGKLYIIPAVVLSRNDVGIEGYNEARQTEQRLKRLATGKFSSAELLRVQGTETEPENYYYRNYFFQLVK